MANIKELIQSIESGDSSFDEKLAAINQMEETLVAMREQEQEAVNDNVELIVEAIKLMEKKVADQLEIAKSIVPEKGDKGDKGQDGLQGRDGLNGKDGRDGQDGKNGLDGSDGVSVTDAKIDFDGSLIITLSTGREINVGEVVAPDLAERLNVISTMSTNTAVANITSGTIDNTTIGATTPSTGVFTTLTATGQTSLGGVAGAEGLRVNTVSSAVNYVAIQGDSSISPKISAAGAGTNLNLLISSKGVGGIGFYSNGLAQQQLAVTHTASAVNYHQLTGSATGSGPIHSVAGSDTNIDLNLTTKGTGSHVLNTGGGTQFKVLDLTSATTSINARGGVNGGNAQFGLVGTGNTDFIQYTLGTGSFRFLTNGIGVDQFRIAHTASAVNYVQVTGAATGNAVYVTAQGSDTNVPMVVQSKGTQPIYFATGGGIQFAILNAASAVNYAFARGGAAGVAASIAVQGSDTNIPLVLQPKGTGALQAQQTDSTATGGNARGANAVDWQTLRSVNSMVASGTGSVIVGGQNNTASSYTSFVGAGANNYALSGNSFVGAGNANVINSNGSYAGIVAGGSNTINGSYGFIGGGQINTAAGSYNFIGGGFTNSGTSASAVTTQSGTMNATTAVTLSGSNASIKVGQYISGTSIAGDTYVAAISGTSLTLSKVASGSSTSTLSFYTPHGVVVGGGNNTATGSYSFIGGGGDAGTAGNRNVASGDNSVVVGGGANTASGIGSFVGGGGRFGAGFGGNVSSGLSSSVVGGLSNSASGSYSFVGGGFANTANSAFSFIGAGSRATTRSIISNSVFSSNSPIVDSPGVSQSALLVLGVQTTDATATVLRSDSSAAGTTNQVILPNNSAYFFTGEVVAGVTGGGNTKGWTIEGVIKRGANAASTALVGTPTVTSTYADAGASTWTIAVTADTTNGGLAVTFTGQASTTIRTVAQIRTTEMTY